MEPELNLNIETNKNGLQLLLIAARDKFNKYPLNMAHRQTLLRKPPTYQ